MELLGDQAAHRAVGSGEHLAVAYVIEDIAASRREEVRFQIWFRVVLDAIVFPA